MSMRIIQTKCLTLILDRPKNLWRSVCQCCRANFHSRRPRAAGRRWGERKGAVLARVVMVRPRSHLVSWKLALAMFLGEFPFFKTECGRLLKKATIHFMNRCTDHPFETEKTHRNTHANRSKQIPLLDEGTERGAIFSPPLPPSL